MCRTLIVFVFTATLGGAFLSACQPRGEQSTVSEVLERARSEFKNSSQVQLDEATRQRVERIASGLEQLLTVTDPIGKRAGASDVADALQAVYLDVGYTSRPALGELINEFRVISENLSQDGKKERGELTPSDLSGQIPLLVSRSYGWLASELEGVKLALRGRESRQ